MSVKCHKETSCAALPSDVAKFKQAMQFLYRIVSHNGCDMIRISIGRPGCDQQVSDLDLSVFG